MKQEISALMDNELSEIEANRVIVSLREDPDVRMAWSTYHLIGDVLRQEHVHRPALEGRILSRLSEEPTVLAPQRATLMARLPRVALAAAASLAAVATVAWMALREPAPQMPLIAEKSRPAPQQVVASPEPADVSEYFRAHQEYALAPAGAVQQAAFSFEPEARDGSR